MVCKYLNGDTIKLKKINQKKFQQKLFKKKIITKTREGGCGEICIITTEDKRMDLRDFCKQQKFSSQATDEKMTIIQRKLAAFEIHFYVSLDLQIDQLRQLALRQAIQ